MTTIKVNANARIFFDDDERDRARNGTPALASLVSREETAAMAAAYAGHPCFTWYGNAYGDIQPGDTLDQVYFGGNLGSVTEATASIYMQHGSGDVGSFTDGQGIEVVVGASSNSVQINYPGISTPGVWPTSATTGNPVTTRSGKSSLPVEATITSLTTNGPDLLAGTLCQQPTYYATADTNGAVIGSDDVHAKGEIVGTRSSSTQALSRFLAVYSDTARRQRPQFGWGRRRGDYIDFTTSKTNFRYIFNQTYGAGGTSFAANKPAITLPLMNAAIGRRTQVRVYVFVKAAMSGATNTGTIGVANKDSGGTMASSATALTNGATISGTTMQWYPDPSAWVASTSPYFMAYAGSTPDRVALCAKSSGSTDSVRIQAFTLIPYHTEV